MCYERANSELHWAITSYSNGFGIDILECEACPRPELNWKPDEYYAELIPVETILSLAKENRHYLEARNAANNTPMDLIDIIIEELRAKADDEYANSVENRWARHNMECLEGLKKAFVEVIDEYNKELEEWENDWKVLIV